MSKERRFGFTRLELLIVVVILAGLGFILMPTMAKRQDEARNTKCQDNLRQLHEALMAYTRDYDHYLPLVQQSMCIGSLPLMMCK